MSTPERQYDFPVEVNDNHTVTEGVGYDGDKFTCERSSSYTHTGAWPAFNYCPFCGHAV